MLQPTKRGSLLDKQSYDTVLKRSKSVQLRPRSKSSKLRHSFIRTRMKLSNTKQSVEPTNITKSKARLKSAKNITSSMEQVVDNLYWAQYEQARLVGVLCDKLNNIQIKHADDKFAIFLNNMGRVQQNLKEIDEMYLMNMKDELVDPLKSFNSTQINKCQHIKLQLKTIKGEYDLTRAKDDNKGSKLIELQSIRDEFMACVREMELEKSSGLLLSIQQYVESHKAYALMHSTNIQQQHQIMMMQPPASNDDDTNTRRTHSDTEDCFMNDFDQVQNTCNDWANSSLIAKQGMFKKRGKFNRGFKKRWFKLFINKKLTYCELNARGDGPSAAAHAGTLMKGHANLSSIIAISTKKSSLIEIQTVKRTWIFHYDTQDERDSWYEAFNTTCIKQQRFKTITETAYDFTNDFSHRSCININSNSCINIREKLDSCHFYYPARVTNCAIFNDGYTVKVSVAADNECVWCINGERYVLNEFIVCSPSEHTINSQRYEMEMQLVHHKENNENEIAVLGFIFTPRIKYKKPKLAFSTSGNHKMVVRQRKKKQNAAVVIVPEFTDDDDDESEDDDTEVEIEFDLDEKYDACNENDFLKQFWDDLPLKETTQYLPLSNALNFDYLFSTATNIFVQNVETNEISVDLPLVEYKGALTTPPYTRTEGVKSVKWYISKNRHYIARKQLNKLSLCWAQL